MSKNDRNRVIIEIVVAFSGYFLDLVEDLGGITSGVDDHEGL